MSLSWRERLLSGEAIPISVVTGFLGSGKTTLINGCLGHPDMAECAILVNEFGEVALDHLLVQEISETVVLLNSGCLCCAVRGDLVEALRGLFADLIRATVPPIRRVVIETSGLADPVPVIHTLMTDPQLFERFRLDNVITTFDAVHGLGQLATHPEVAKQVAFADRIVVTKADLAGYGGVAVVTGPLRALNATARVLDAATALEHPGDLFETARFQSGSRSADVDRWLEEAEATAATAALHEHAGAHGLDHERHDAAVKTFTILRDEPLVWERLVTWLVDLLSLHGDAILRIKGMVGIEGQEGPTVIHGVQHIFYPPAVLPEWPSEDRRSRIVFIVRDLVPRLVEESFAASVRPLPNLALA